MTSRRMIEVSRNCKEIYSEVETGRGVDDITPLREEIEMTVDVDPTTTISRIAVVALPEIKENGPEGANSYRIVGDTINKGDNKLHFRIQYYWSLDIARFLAEES